MEKLVPVFMPSLAATLLNAENRKGLPLTYDEVIEIRDKSPCVMIPVSGVHAIEASRGYLDLDPENCWEEWQRLRIELIPGDTSL